MSTESTNPEVLKLLEKLNKSKKPKNTGNATTNGFVDYKALNEEKKKAMTKCVPGKNKFVFIVPEGASDPFFEWGTHAGLQETKFWTVDCNHHNKGESCVVCNMVEHLRAEDKDKNKPLYYPINKKVDYYAVVVNVENAKTIAEGPKWLRITKTVLDQITVWLENLEGSDEPFYSETAPQRIILTYDDAKDVAAKDRYKVDKSSIAPFSEDQLADIKSKIKPLNWCLENFVKTQDQIKDLLEKYLIRTKEQLDSENDNSSGNDTDAETNQVDEKADKKLGSLHNK